MSRKVMMQRTPDEIGLFSLATFQTLRLEALDLFDRSLAEGKPEILERFLEQQVAQEPPPLELLSQIAEDVHQRLAALRQNHFDGRDQLRQTILRQYSLDLSLFLPADPMDYHPLNLEAALHFISGEQAHLSAENHRTLRQMLQEALAEAALRYQEVMLADHLYRFLMDWLMALHVVTMRGAWADDLRIPTPHHPKIQ